MLTTLLRLLFFSSPTRLDDVAVVIDDGGGIRGQEIICMGGPETVLNLCYTRHECIEAPSIRTHSTTLRLFPVQQNQYAAVVAKYNLVHKYNNL